MTRDIEYLHAHLFGRFLGSASTDVGGGGGIGARIKRRKVGVGGVHDDIFHAHSKDFGGDLRDDGIGAGADIGGANKDIE